MVGVPGKSKGCSTCRRRKKGCDQKRPICGQCAQSGYVCGGYQRDLTFILHPSSKTAEKAYFFPRSARTTSLALMPSLDRSAIETQCRSLFWNIYLPHGAAEVNVDFLRKCAHPPNWISMILELNGDDTALELAFSALSISRVGRSNNDLRLVKESTKLYGRALKDLQKALYDPCRMYSEEVLTACSLLGLYEVFEGGGTAGKSVGWVSHAQGAARLVELRGPDKHNNRQAHHVFLGARLPIIYSAILHRKRTFLSDESWLTVPWQNATKTYFDRLVDIATKIPELLERFDYSKLSTSTKFATEEYTDLLKISQDLLTQLIKWAEVRKSDATPKATKYKHSEGDLYPFDRYLTFGNHLFLNANLVLWTCSLVVSDTIKDIETCLLDLKKPVVDVRNWTANYQKAPHQYAIYIAQAIPYCLMAEMGGLGANHISFPLHMAFKYFLEAREDRICTWMIQICDGMRQQGMRIGNVADLLRQSKRSRSSLIGSTQQWTTTSKGDASDGENDWALSPSSIDSAASFRTTFIYENPSQYYIDATEAELSIS